VSFDDHLFVRLLGVALLLHEAVYAADLGVAFFVDTFAPVFGVRVPRGLKLVAHVALIATLGSLVAAPDSAIARLALLPALTLCCIAASGRLSNHLVVAWCFALCLFADASIATGLLPAAAAPILAIVYGASGFAKLNADYFADDIGCGSHLARTLIVAWDIALIRRRLSAGSLSIVATRGIVVAETLLAVGIIVAPRHVAPVAIALHLLFGLLCHVHFSGVMTAGVVYVAGLDVPSGVVPLVMAILVGAWIGFRFGNWRPYQHRRLAAAGQMAYGIVAIAALEAATLAALSPGERARPDLFDNPAALVIVSLFALNCATPYLGVKQAFSFAMFSNLRPDRWTHRVVARPLVQPLTRYYHVAALSGLPEIGSLDHDVTARRAASELLMFAHRKYSVAFLAGVHHLFPELHLTLRVGGDLRPLGELVESARWWMIWCLDPLVLPIDERARVCE